VEHHRRRREPQQDVPAKKWAKAISDQDPGEEGGRSDRSEIGYAGDLGRIPLETGSA